MQITEVIEDKGNLVTSEFCLKDHECAWPYISNMGHREMSQMSLLPSMVRQKSKNKVIQVTWLWHKHLQQTSHRQHTNTGTKG